MSRAQAALEKLFPLLLRRSLWLGVAAGAVACSGKGGASRTERMGEAPPTGGKLFTSMPAAYTGVRFENRLTETRELNVFTYRNFYNGGGVAIGDLTGDGLPELVLTANQGGARLFLNEGKFRFRDVTEEAGLDAPAEWTTGVLMADFDGDGRLDLYVCHAGQTEPEKRANALWINRGVGEDSVPRFEEEGERFGVADRGFATHAAVLDYDRDGDLDLFVINNSPRPVSSFGEGDTRRVRDPYGGHKLFRNDGGRFTDVSAAAGIYGSEIGFGLGLGVGDVDRDGWPDVWVSNDFFERDYLYVNRRDGTFAEQLERATTVDSYFSMGMDIGDVDNDGWPDVYTTDMLPEDEYRLRTMSSFEGWEVYQAKVRDGYHHQFMRNMLQRNNGDGSFSDVGQLAGVARTDWSWAALITDLDMDGWKDIFVTNGLVRDVTSQDYLAFLSNDETMNEARRGNGVDYLKLIGAMSSTKLSSYAFRNEGGLAFRNSAAAWGVDAPGFSSGAAYGDLDGDGGLDLVVNSVNGEALVYRNNARSVTPERHFLQVRLEGTGKNTFAVGARVTLSFGGADSGVTLVQELFPSRGFQSSVDYVLTFGLGARDSVARVTVEWPDGRRSEVGGVAADQRLTLRHAEATAAPVRPSAATESRWVAVLDSAALPAVHRENEFVDFDRERLIPKLMSTEGPALAVGDVDGDGLDDIYLGGAKGQAGSLLLQRKDGSFIRGDSTAFAADAISEDVGAVFFDADGDGDRDLYVVSGGSEYSDLAPALQDRLYVNDGRGRFTRRPGAVPDEASSGSRVAVADYDGDGDADLFVGGRVVPWRYGEDPQSLLLRNDGRGNFTNVIAQLAPELERVGMVTDAVWQDVDGDRRPELVVVGEWMPVTVFHNAGGGRLTRRPLEGSGLDSSAGWWNRIVAADVDGDGRVDFVVGNLGLNTRLRATPSEPATMVVKDFDGNGFAEAVLATYSQGKLYPLALRDDLIAVIPPLAPRFVNYTDYAKATFDDVFRSGDLAGSKRKTVATFATSVVRNEGNGRFRLVPLPAEAQLAPVYGIVAQDLDGDGHTDLLLAGNFDGFKPDIGRAAESRGVALAGDGKGGFRVVQGPRSGFVVSGEARDIRRVRGATGDLLVVARNNARPLAFRQVQRDAAGRR